MLGKLILIGGLVSRFLLSNFSGDSLPDKDKIALEIISEVAKEMGKKYKVHPIGHTIHKGFKYIEISYELRGQLSQDAVRKLLVDGAEKLLSHIQEREDFKPYLPTNMGYRNVGVLLFMQDQDGRGLYHPEIGIAKCRDGKISYRTMDPEKLFGYKETFEESYAEAVAIVKAQQASIAQSK